MTRFAPLKLKEKNLNAEEVLLMYKIEDPVYKGLIRWRMSMLEFWAKKFLGEGVERILEIGTGNFPFSTVFGQKNSKTHFVGIERDHGQSERAKLHLEGQFASSRMEHSLWDESTATRMGSESFDLVTSFEVYEHVPAEANFIANANRV